MQIIKQIFLLSSILLLYIVRCYAQVNVVKIEYYIDTDPGIGRGISLTIIPDTNLSNLNIPLNPTGLSEGVHRFFVRAEDINGNWSLTNSLLFYKPFNNAGVVSPLKKITAVEYYIDNDPGSGNATPLNITADTNLANLIIPINPTALAQGVHCFYVRAKDASGKWSLTNSLLFYKPYTPATAANILSNIKSVEYYFDNDPGLGNATPLNILPGTDLANLILPINMERLSPCGHKMYIRAKDANGNWSLVNSYSFINNYQSLPEPPGDYMVQFDGVNDYLDLGTWFKLPSFTISFWVKPDASQTSGAAIAALQNDLYFYSNPTVNSNYILSHLLQFDLAPGKWNHVTITADSVTQIRKVYLFGQLIDSNQWAYSPKAGFDLRFGNGGFFPANYFNGQLDEIKLWDNVLTPDKIYQNVNKRLNGTEQGLIGYWDFNNGCNIQAIDKTPNHHDGTLLNGALKLVSTVPSVGQQIIPNKGGQGKVTVKIYDNLFQQGAIARLTRNGFANISADTTLINNNGTIATCIFNFAGKDTGLYNLTITNLDTIKKIYNNSFTIQGVDSSGNINVQMLGANVFRQGNIHQFLIVYQNTSNIDVRAPAFSLQSFGQNFIAFSQQDFAYRWQILPVLLGNRIVNNGYNGFSNSDSILTPGTIYSIPIYAFDSSSNGFRKNSSEGPIPTCEELSNYVFAGRFPDRPDFEGSNGHADLPIKRFINNGHNYIDGCSNPKILVDIINIGIGANENWNDLFLPACADHDLCYQTCYKKNQDGTLNLRAKEICDDDLFYKMNKICENWVGDKDDCKNAAMAYYIGVRKFGENSFADDQKFCTGGPNQPSFPSSGSTYAVPDCNCLPGEICFKPTKIGPFDPNEKIGPSKFQKGNLEFNYLINFENLPTATAPAQDVTIIDTLDKTKFDISSFSFGVFGFGDTLSPATYQLDKSFSQNIDLRPEKNLIVNVSGRLDTTLGIVYWKFISLDPATMLLTEEPRDGFLPPADSISNRGEGWVSFNIKPYDTLATGSSLKNKATIIFDFNNPIVTDTFQNIIDRILPLSKVLSLPRYQSDSNFVVKWKGADSISGVKQYNIYVSIDSSSYVLWEVNTSDTTDIYPGHLNHTYSFYSIATDSAENIEASKTLLEAITTITTSTLPVTLIDFSGKIQNPKSAFLIWRITNQQDFSHFEIEHSINGNDFNKIGSVNEIVIGQSVESYSFIDKNAAGGDNFYRLKMVDLDGHFTYTKIVNVYISIPNKFIILPNPAHSYITVRGNNLRQIILMTANGKLIKKYSVAGNTENKIPINNYAAGVYFVTLIDSKQNQETQKLIIY